MVFIKCRFHLVSGKCKRERGRDPTTECCSGFQGKTVLQVLFIFFLPPLGISIAFSACNLRSVDLASMSDDYWILCCDSESL